MNFKDLVGRRMTKPVKFMGEDVKISKLTVAEVKEIQAQAAAAEGQEDEGFGTLCTVIRLSVPEAAEISDEDFAKFPIDELSKLSSEIMKFSGIGTDAGKP